MVSAPFTSLASVGATAAPPSFLRSLVRALLAGLVGGGFAAAATVPVQAVWRWSEGRVSSAALLAVAIVVAAPLLGRAARAIAGEAGPRFLWQGAAALLPVFVYACTEGFFKACGSSPIFAMGSLAGDDVEPEVVLGLPVAWALGTVVAFLVDRLRERAGVAVGIVAAASRALPWATVLGSLVLILAASMVAGRAPTAERYLASLERVGTIPAVTLPTTPPNRPAVNPTNAEAYPYRMPAAPDMGFQITRFCSDSACFVYLARAPFPETFDTDRFPRPHIAVYASGGASIDVWRDRGRGLLALRVGEGVRQWHAEASLDRLYAAKEIAGFLAAPPMMIGVAAFGIAAAIALAFAGRLRRSALDLPWQGARVEDGFIRFEDGTPPAPAPAPLAAGHPRELLVVTRVEEAGGAAFRDARAPTIVRVFLGTPRELEALREERRAGRRAAMFAVVVVAAAPLFTVFGISQGW